MARLHLHEFGDRREPLVCLHGVTGHGQRFERLGERLPGWRLIAPDMRGHGRSTYDPPWTTERLRSTCWRPCPTDRWTGSGSPSAAASPPHVAATAPARVKRLILLDPALTLPAGTAGERADLARETEVYADAADYAEQTLAEGTLFRTSGTCSRRTPASTASSTADGPA